MGLSNDDRVKFVLKPLLVSLTSGPYHCVFKTLSKTLQWLYLAVGWARRFSRAFKTPAREPRWLSSGPHLSLSLIRSHLHLSRCEPLDFRSAATSECADRTVNSARKIWAVHFRSEKRLSFPLRVFAPALVAPRGGIPLVLVTLFCGGFLKPPVSFV